MISEIPVPTKKEIRSFCGSTMYSRGESYFLSGKVTNLAYDPEQHSFHAVVKGTKRYNVNVVIDEESVSAECDCPAFDSWYGPCKHIAAVLLQIEHLAGPRNRIRAEQLIAMAVPFLEEQAIPHKLQQSKPVIAPAIRERDMQLARNVLSLFERPAVQAPVTAVDGMAKLLTAEFYCRIRTGYRNMVLVELKVGLSRLYTVQKIRDFLDKWEKRQPIAFSKLFTLDPGDSAFREHDAEIIQLLCDVYRNERAYQEIVMPYSYSSNDKGLLIPPSAWDSLLDKLLQAEAAVRYEIDGISLDRFEVRDGNVPLQFRLGPGPVEQSFQISMQGLFQLRILPNYRLAVTSDGILYRMDSSVLTRLQQLQQLFASGEQKLTIAPQHVEAFMRKVLPELQQIGELSVEESIAGRIVSEQLKANVYLDRDGEQITASVKFVYGTVEIDPLAPEGGNASVPGDLLVMRQAEREKAVMDILALLSFRNSDGRFVLDSEDAIYEFLTSGLQRLKQSAEVYATPAFHALRSPRPPRPRVQVDLDSAANWLEVRFDVDGIEQKDLIRLLHSVREKKTFHRLSDGSFLSLDDPYFREIGELFDHLDIRKSELKSTGLKLSIVRGLALPEPDGKGSSAVKLGKSLRRLLDNLKHPDNLEFEPPQSLAAVLRDYQTFGFQWMKTLSHYSFGGILADDMGLGKTLQSIAYLLSEKEQGGEKQPPALIVCPASLVYNWRNEIAKFAPRLKAAVAAGSKQERKAVIEGASQLDVLITSYPLLRRDVELYAQHTFHALILDEAQAFKNSATQTAQAVKSISAVKRFALTGTPVENRLEELWSIFDAVFPELFAGRKAFSELSSEQLARKVRPFILRRLKSDVLSELPDKIETLQTSEMHEDQKKLYLAYLLKLQQETSRQLREEGFQKSRMKILAGLTRLRQLCCHPSLFIENYKGGSGKLDQLLELVEECLASGKRMLVFSQFTEMLGLIRKPFDSRGWNYFYLDGSTRPNERVELCRRFNEGEADIFLISLKAGGTGLNLTGADTVILYDLWWNPAVEQQAADRAHRIGQKNVVHVIRLIAEGTIEEKMYELQQKKKDLIDSVVQSGDEALASITEEDIREILTI